MTIVNDDATGTMSVDTAGEGDPSNDNWDPGSYLDAVREDLASAFATAPSLPPAVQGTNPIAKPLRIQETPRSTPGRTSIHGRPIILRNLDKHSSSLLTQEETSHLLRSLTQRDVAILQALHDYRYLNTLQIQHLFFHGIRSTQMRLQFLSNHGLIYRWQMIDPPGLTRRPSLLLLTPRGGRLLAEFRGHSPWSYIRRAEDARDHCWHVTHDLEANGFFVDLALASRLQVDQGLLLWIGEESSRSSRRTWAKAHRRPIATPDGEGLYLSRDRTITFDLEWDRGTESIGRLRSKLRTYVGFYEDTRGADREHVLFVLHRTSREELFHRLARELFLTGRHCCRFWTTTVERIDHVGPLGPLWAPVEGPDAGEDDDEELVEPKPIDLKRLRRRRLTDLPARETSDRTIADCIGRDNWWVRRPGGGEVA
jgi:protein involved in plasmid replication-relaxation